jgi:hypothetical protein
MRWGLGVAAAAGLLAAAAARGDLPAGAGERPRMRGDVVCELEQVDRATASSRRCIACHDGTLGEGFVFAMPGSDIGMSHPVDVDYEAAAARHPGEYVPRAQLPPEVPLVQGKVACTSCHDGRSSEPHHIPSYESLCLSCHVK